MIKVSIESPFRSDLDAVSLGSRNPSSSVILISIPGRGRQLSNLFVVLKSSFTVYVLL